MAMNAHNLAEVEHMWVSVCVNPLYMCVCTLSISLYIHLCRVNPRLDLSIKPGERVAIVGGAK